VTGRDLGQLPRLLREALPDEAGSVGEHDRAIDPPDLDADVAAVRQDALVDQLPDASRIVASDRTRQVETGQRGSQDRGGDEGRVEGPGPLRSLARVADHQDHPDGPDEQERRQARDGEPDDDVRLSRGPGTRGHLRSCIGTDPAMPEGHRTSGAGRPGGRVD
jgi:hypothetical protein